MHSLKTKITSAISTAVLFSAAVIMTGLGFALAAALAVFALLTLAVALLSAPFVGFAEDRSRDAYPADSAA